MFDDLRNSANDQSFPDEIDGELEPLLNKSASKPSKSISFDFLKKLGLTAFQRFILSALIFVLVIILGFMFVMITSSVMSS